MDSDESITLSALKFVSGESEHVCRLCFASTENQEFSLEDSVKAQSSYINKTLTIQDMFSELGVPSEPYLPQVICENCAYATINSYLFKTLCKYSNEKWMKTVDTLERSLSETQNLSPKIQTAFIVVKEDENFVFTSRTFNGVKTKSEAAVKMKRLIANKIKYLNRVRTIVCEECGVQKSSLKSLIKHMETHSNNMKMDTQIDKQEIEKKPLPCPECMKIFSAKYKLTAHFERVHTAKKFQCPKCAKMFSSITLLKAHDKDHHIATNCKLCFVQFPSRVALRRHMDRHGDNKCIKCNKSFKHRTTYRCHIKTCGDPTSKTNNFFCDICNKGYMRKNGLRSHLRTDHGFGRVLACNWCGKKYDALSKLKMHIVKHTRERNFYCEHCGGKFVTPAALRYHIRLHTGERPFPCDLCEENFLSASRRMEHKRRKHFAPTKECHICHIKFPTSNQLKKHVERHSNPHSKLYVPGFDKVTIVKEGETKMSTAIFGF